MVWGGSQSFGGLVLMERRIRHTAYVDLPFEDVCRRLADSGDRVLARATANASSRADHLVIHLDKGLRFFHLDELVTITASPLVRQGVEMASMDLNWHADRRKRLLPNLDAELLVHPLIQSGPNATTALSIVGVFAPPSSIFRRVDEALFTRHLIDAVAKTFIDSVTRILADPEEEQEE